MSGFRSDYMRHCGGGDQSLPLSEKERFSAELRRLRDKERRAQEAGDTKPAKPLVNQADD